MVTKYKQVYTGLLWAVNEETVISAAPHIDYVAADLWTAAGDITLIGFKLYAAVNPLPNTNTVDTGGVYCYSELSLVARWNEQRSSLIQTRVQVHPVETPTIGEHGLWAAPPYSAEQVILPEGYGIDMDRWHPMYLNMSYRAFFTGGGFEMAAGAQIYYVER